MFFSIVQNNTNNLTGSLILKETAFDCIIIFSIKGNGNKHFLGFISHLDKLNENIKKYWESENLDYTPSLKDEEI